MTDDSIALMYLRKDPIFPSERLAESKMKFSLILAFSNQLDYIQVADVNMIINSRVYLGINI